MQRLLDFLVALLNRIQFWAVRWKVDYSEAFPVSPQKSLEERTAMPRSAVHNHDKPRIMPQKFLEEADNFSLVHRAVECRKDLPP